MARGSVVTPVDPALKEIANASEAKPSAMRKSSRNDIIYLLLAVKDKKIRSPADQTRKLSSEQWWEFPPEVDQPLAENFFPDLRFIPIISIVILSWWSDLNRRPAVYETAALPLSYTSMKLSGLFYH